MVGDLGTPMATTIGISGSSGNNNDGIVEQFDNDASKYLYELS